MEPAILTPKEIGDSLKAKGVKPSVIRIMVMQYLLENRVHPNADAIYKVLIKEIPTLSKTSIYNTLKTLSSKGLILEVLTHNGEIRFDGYPRRHAHFMCVECGSIMDAKLECETCRTPDLNGCRVTEQSIYLKGVCAICGSGEKKHVRKNGKSRQGG